MKLKFLTKKLIWFWLTISLKVLTKLSTNFGHFSWTIVIKMKPRSNLCSKKPQYHILYHTHHPLWTKLSIKYTETLALLDDIQHKLSRIYRFVHNSAVFNRMQSLDLTNIDFFTKTFDMQNIEKWLTPFWKIYEKLNKWLFKMTFFAMKPNKNCRYLSF